MKCTIPRSLKVRDTWLKSGWHGEIIKQRSNGLGDLFYEVRIIEQPVSVLLKPDEFQLNSESEQS